MNSFAHCCVPTDVSALCTHLRRAKRLAALPTAVEMRPPPLHRCYLFRESRHEFLRSTPRKRLIFKPSAWMQERPLEPEIKPVDRPAL